MKYGRELEWQHAILFLVIGIVLMLPPEFTTPTFLGMTKLFNEFYWGLLFCLVGSVRVIALAINGYRPIGSPIARIIGAITTMVFSSIVCYSFFSVFPYGLWGGSVYFIVLLFEIVIIHRATKDLKYGIISRAA